MTSRFAACAREMVVPYQIWMLQRLGDVLDQAVADSRAGERVTAWLGGFRGGDELLELNERLAGCRVRKDVPRLSTRSTRSSVESGRSEPPRA
ncbi:MAG: hypothetical protein CMQ24_04965 [Gammaproteobacteria bacterium]|nr:hypothetical protein [Gammaproteobacteria bacterium]